MTGFCQIINSQQINNKTTHYSLGSVENIPVHCYEIAVQFAIKINYVFSTPSIAFFPSRCPK